MVQRNHSVLSREYMCSKLLGNMKLEKLAWLARSLIHRLIPATGHSVGNPSHAVPARTLEEKNNLGPVTP